MELPVEPMWNQPEPEPLMPHAKASIEERMDVRRKWGMKRLVDCSLPDGFRLVTVRPKQMWIEQQVRWAFMLGFVQRGRAEVLHVARYESNLPDALQMQWALGDFIRNLTVAGYEVSRGISLADPVKKRVLPVRLPTYERMQLGMVQ
jgi:hypothetical protein